MKLTLALLSAAFAQDDSYAVTEAPENPISEGRWPGQSTDNPCGSQFIHRGLESANQTCTIVYDDARFTPWRVFVGGQYILSDYPYQFTSFDGVDPKNVDVVVFWEQAEGPDGPDGPPDNSTCADYGDLSVECEPYGGPWPGVYFQETTNDFRNAKNGNYNIQIAGAVAGDVLTMYLKDSYDGEWACQNLTTNSGEIVVDGPEGVQEDAWGNKYSDTGRVTINVGDETAQIVNLFTVQQPGMNWEPNMWKSTVQKS